MLARINCIFSFLLIASFSAIFGYQKVTPAAKADIALLNGNIITMNRKYPQAQAVAIRGNTIIKVGTNKEVGPFIGDKTKVIDLEGKSVIPGLIDAHIHPFRVGRALMGADLDLRGLTKEQILDKVAQRVKETKKGAWITGEGWDQGFWKVKEFPTKYELDVVAPDNPVALSRIDGHSSWYNSQVLQLSNIDKETSDPDGGRILRDAYGEPTGMLVDDAQGLIKRENPDEGTKDKEAQIKLAMEQFKKWGLTGIHDAYADQESLRVYEKLKQEGELTVRVYAMIRAGSDAFPEYLSKGPQIDNFLTVRSVKMFIDGALGSRGALLFEPYSDLPDTSGLQMMKEEEAYSMIKRSLEKGFQVCTHAIGDKANNIMLNLYQRALKEDPVENHRFRVEHASVIQKEDLPRFKELSVIPSMQPVFIGEYGRWSEDRLGPERVINVLPFRQLLDAGVIIAGGTDYIDSDSGNPMVNYYCAVARKSPFGVPKEFCGKEKVTREEALRMLTLDAAYAAFDDNIKGSIEASKLADVVVLNQDLMNIDEEQILDTEVVMTILDGRIIYSR